MIAFRRHLIRLVPAALAVVLASCAGSSKPDADVEEIAKRSDDGMITQFEWSDEDVQFGEDGMTPTGGRRSQYEGQRQVLFGGDWGKEQYAGSGTASQANKTWWGADKNRATKSYAGAGEASQYDRSSNFASQRANADGRASRFDDRAFANQQQYRTSSAAAESRPGLGRPSDAETDERRRLYQPPRIMGYREYQQKTIEDTRTLLGRDD